jgi:hypothetical protein
MMFPLVLLLRYIPYSLPVHATQEFLSFKMHTCTCLFLVLVGSVTTELQSIFIQNSMALVWPDFGTIIGDQVHARWLLETSSATSCTLVVKVGKN